MRCSSHRGRLTLRLGRIKFNFPFYFASTAANVTTLMAAAVAFFTDADWDTCKEAFTSAPTSSAGSGSLAVTFSTQKSVWHPIHSLFDTNETAFQRPYRARDHAWRMPTHPPPALSISLGAPEYGIGEVRAGCVGAA
jgi:hypothetical protein